MIDALVHNAASINSCRFWDAAHCDAHLYVQSSARCRTFHSVHRICGIFWIHGSSSTVWNGGSSATAEHDGITSATGDDGNTSAVHYDGRSTSAAWHDGNTIEAESSRNVVLLLLNCFKAVSFVDLRAHFILESGQWKAIYYCVDDY